LKSDIENVDNNLSKRSSVFEEIRKEQNYIIENNQAQIEQLNYMINNTTYDISLVENNFNKYKIS
jgi:hypothetical protein